MNASSLDKALAELKELFPVTIDLSLDRLYRLLDKLGNPQDKTPPVIHVAGTNGKGSTIAFTRAILEAAGYKCHVYTSPHLVHFNERIRLAGELARDEYLLELLDEIKTINAGDGITFFEITTAMAFLAFARVPADALLLEVGLGGLNDATNVVKDPLVTAITTISYDHCDWLGRSLPEIAGQKAGIMKPGVPCIVGHQMPWARDEVLPVFRERAESLKAALHVCDEGWRAEKGDEGMSFCWRGQDYVFPSPNLLGEHQVWNAGTAIAMLKAQDHFRIPDDAIASGVTQAEWPGRLERIARGPVAALLPAGWELWYDGAHNDSCGEVLARQLQEWRSVPGSAPIHVVAGMLKSKNPLACIGPLLQHIDSLSAFSFQTGAYDPTGPNNRAEDLAEILKPLWPGIMTYESLREAVQGVLVTRPPGKILVTGTLYAYKGLV